MMLDGQECLQVTRMLICLDIGLVVGTIRYGEQGHEVVIPT